MAQRRVAFDVVARDAWQGPFSCSPVVMEFADGEAAALEAAMRAHPLVSPGSIILVHAVDPEIGEYFKYISGAALPAAGVIRARVVAPAAPAAAGGAAEAPSARGRVAAMLRKLPAASSFARPAGDDSWSGSTARTRGFTSLLRFNRTPQPLDSPQQLHDEKLAAVPVTLLDPILAQLAEDCESLAPTAADCRFAGKVAVGMSRAYPDKEARARALRELLGDEYGISLATLALGSGETDGSVPGRDGHGLVFSVEVRNEIGGDGVGCPHIQNAAYAAHFAAREGSRFVRERSVCPTALLELAGPNMSVSGSVFSACSSCEQLTAMVPLLWMPHSPLMLHAARCFGALRKALTSLSAFYASIAQAAARQLEYPYPSTFTAADGSRAAFKYTSALTPRCFNGTCGDLRLVIKFARTYCAAAHAFAAEQGFAPRLLSTQQLPGGWLMVVMEHVEGAAAWGDAMVPDAGSGQLLREAVGKLHAGGWVHGDLREGNVVLAGKRVLLLDFDWAGRAGEVRYPFFMNSELPWPEGAADGQLITPHHDMHWVELLASR